MWQTEKLRQNHLGDVDVNLVRYFSSHRYLSLNLVDNTISCMQKRVLNKEKKVAFASENLLSVIISYLHNELMELMQDDILQSLHGTLREF